MTIKKREFILICSTVSNIKSLYFISYWKTLPYYF